MKFDLFSFNFLVKNTKFSSWGVGSKSSCGGNTVTSQCVNATDGASIEEMNLIEVTCTESGFTCGDQKKLDPENPTTCPIAVKNRFECPHQGSKLVIKTKKVFFVVTFF